MALGNRVRNASHSATAPDVYADRNLSEFSPHRPQAIRALGTSRIASDSRSIFQRPSRYSLEGGPWRYSAARRHRNRVPPPLVVHPIFPRIIVVEWNRVLVVSGAVPIDQMEPRNRLPRFHSPCKSRMTCPAVVQYHRFPIARMNPELKPSGTPQPARVHRDRRDNLRILGEPPPSRLPRVNDRS